MLANSCIWFRPFSFQMIHSEKKAMPITIMIRNPGSDIDTPSSIKLPATSP